MSLPIQIFACQNRTCRRDGGDRVLAALEAEIIHQGLAERVQIEQTGCLGQCGNGPMLIVVQPATHQEVWYDRVRPEEVPQLVREHLVAGRPVADMLYRHKHPKRQFPDWTPLPPPWQTIP
ncbi:(2Fe-2S) ferredoxin domain-containing protein [Gloeobacter kilaueensis]|uniref:NADH dehydrogenase (Quinone) n=1 Tax=Gloeobacter kilaueensis (strain ATCC BAA-2537 / CCAP 1431/1 / ULC 316 / JS1) TaxID=1183438 RepID=U5QQZ6_GLOK1|nr:(2Fe-2S) ferredoxin domain-containing protein [Gloeobacter kilaueensis]AGY60074.1 NADH dehydrogenase (quinone) [Gloeobacter kilaueensis JS1]